MMGEHIPVEITQRRLKRGMLGTTQGGGRLQSYWVADLVRNTHPPNKKAAKSRFNMLNQYNIGNKLLTW